MVTAATKRASKKGTPGQTYLVGDVGGTRTRLALYAAGERSGKKSRKGSAPLVVALNATFNVAVCPADSVFGAVNPPIV